MLSRQYDAQDRVAVYYDMGAPGPSVLAGRMVHPGERHVVTYAAYRKVAANPRFKLLDANGDVVEDTPGAAISNEEVAAEMGGAQNEPADTAPPASTETDAEGPADTEADDEADDAVDGAPAFEPPGAMYVNDALAYAVTLDLDALVAFRDTEAAYIKPRSSLLGPLDDMISRASGPEEEDDG